MDFQEGSKSGAAPVSGGAGGDAQGTETPRKRGFWRWVTETCWHAPVLNLAALAGWAAGSPVPMLLDHWGQTQHLEFLRFLANIVFLVGSLLWAGTLVLLPVVVVVQLVRRQWKTALESVLLGGAVAGGAIALLSGWPWR